MLNNKREMTIVHKVTIESMTFWSLLQHKLAVRGVCNLFMKGSSSCTADYMEQFVLVRSDINHAW